MNFKLLIKIKYIFKTIINCTKLQNCLNLFIKVYKK